ncbi:MAG: hypothetical protein M3Q30_24805, partial [Actinomycetota bacterium]|nr:hypothetical protein [Actinomycetota bacterium]
VKAARKAVCRNEARAAAARGQQDRLTDWSSTQNECCVARCEPTSVHHLEANRDGFRERGFFRRETFRVVQIRDRYRKSLSKSAIDVYTQHPEPDATIGPAAAAGNARRTG